MTERGVVAVVAVGVVAVAVAVNVTNAKTGSKIVGLTRFYSGELVNTRGRGLVGLVVGVNRY